MWAVLDEWQMENISIGALYIICAKKIKKLIKKYQKFNNLFQDYQPLFFEKFNEFSKSCQICY
jgi:hypothetical protein